MYFDFLGILKINSWTAADEGYHSIQGLISSPIIPGFIYDRSTYSKEG